MGKYFKYVLIGAMAGLANGIFGSGGGLFLVPLFTNWLHIEQRKSFATSVAVILPLSIVSAVTYYFRGTLEVMTALPYLAGGIAGGIISGKAFKKIPLTFLRKAFGILIIYGGVRAVFNI